MAVSGERSQAQAQSIDVAFAQLVEDGSGCTTQAPDPPSSRAAADPVRLEPMDSQGDDPYAEPEPPPWLADPSDRRAARDWLEQETKRLEAYTRGQFALIEQPYQALLAKHFQGEEAITLWEQEMNRQTQFLASQNEGLQQQARELVERETALTAQMEKLAHAQQELLALQQTADSLREGSAAQRVALERQRAETADFQVAAPAAETDVEGFATAFTERPQSWENKQAEWNTRHVQMEQRYQALEKAEAASKRWAAELDELENQLRREFDRQGQRLASEQREMELLRAELLTLTQEYEKRLRESARHPLSACFPQGDAEPPAS